MNRLQDGELLGMVAKGTPGGEPRLDGSPIEAGIHLRWQMAQALGFPPDGFDLYRRVENYREFLRCGNFRAADVVGVAWVPYDPEDFRVTFSITFSGEVEIVHGCGADSANAASFPGQQEVRLDFNQPARYVRIVFDERTTPNPVAEAYWQSSSGDVLAARKRARLENGFRLITLFADRIDSVVLTGENLVICEVCFVLVIDGYLLDWPQIPLNGGDPIYLPVTHPEWNSPHPHTPDDQAEAEARLPAGLPALKWDAYAQGFQDELHPILYDLVGSNPQHLFRLQETDLESAAVLDWPALSLLQIMAVDPNIARILGLYWIDAPPSADRFFDYRVIAHYGDQLFPGKQFLFAELEPGRRCGPFFEHQSLTYTSPNPIDVVRLSWDGSEQTGLLFTREILAAPIAIALPEPVKSVTLRFTASAAVAIKYSLGYKELHVAAHGAGEVTAVYEDEDSFNKILLFTFGELTLFEVALRETIGPIGDLVYDVYHVRQNAELLAFTPSLDPPLVVAAATGLDETGTLMLNQSQVGLHWERLEAGGDFLRSYAPVQYQVRRDELGPDGAILQPPVILNENAPAIISGPDGAVPRLPLYVDRSVPDGAYAYAVRGIDLFGVLGEWSQTQTVEVEDHRPPPPPQSVQAQYLDPADPYLDPEDRDWAAANGPGLKLAWVWPGILRLQAPDVSARGAEFRAYATLGALNRLEGTVNEVTTRAGISDLQTDIDWPGAADALAGETIRVNQNFYQVTGNTQGPNCLIGVKTLTTPDLVPTPGPCSLTFSRGRSYWRDYAVATHWQVRLHVEPVQDAPVVLAAVTAVVDFAAEVPDGDPLPVMARSGATRTLTLNQPLQDPEGVLVPGVLLCDGIVYPAYGHTLGDALQVHFAPMVAPADSALLIEPAVGAACTYFPGRRYETRLPGLRLEIPAGQAAALAQVAMSSSDGKTYVQDDPVWSRPGRGGLGGRAGNESPLSPAVTVQAVLRTPPPAVANVPLAPEEPIFAAPADYYGQARYTLAWEAVPGAAGYAVYRCSGAALFDQDRALRQGQKPPYDTGSVFADDPGFAAWLEGFDPALSEAEMAANPENHVDAWRAWAGRFYAQISDAKIQELASLEGNLAVFRRLNAETLPAASYADRFDGRGQGVYLYRVRTVDAAGNLSAWSSAYPPVHIFDVTPPGTPVVTSVTGGERSVILKWRLNREKDLGEYWIWRDLDGAALADVRRIPATAVVLPGGGPTVTFVDEGLDGLQTYYYRIAALDTNRNVSPPTALIAARTIDTTPPNAPTWTNVAWVADRGRTAVQLAWQTDEPGLTCTVQRRPLGGGIWIAVSDELGATAPPFDFEYYERSAEPDSAYEYRLLVKDSAGNKSVAFSIAQIRPEE